MPPTIYLYTIVSHSKYFLPNICLEIERERVVETHCCWWLYSHCL